MKIRNILAIIAGVILIIILGNKCVSSLEKPNKYEPLKINFGNFYDNKIDQI